MRILTKTELDGIWNYYLTLEGDLADTSRYIEPAGQENVYSFEFAKLLILSCTEIESVFKIICKEIVGQQVEGNIAKYKEVILKKYPKITEATVTVNRLGKNIEPFATWSSGTLTWWSAYQEVKHYRGGYFNKATYINAVTAIAALYILIFYLGKITGIDFPDTQSNYISSDYSHQIISFGVIKRLPDFEVLDL